MKMVIENAQTNLKDLIKDYLQIRAKYEIFMSDTYKKARENIKNLKKFWVLSDSNNGCGRYLNKYEIFDDNDIRLSYRSLSDINDEWCVNTFESFDLNDSTFRDNPQYIFHEVYTEKIKFEETLKKIICRMDIAAINYVDLISEKNLEVIHNKYPKDAVLELIVEINEIFYNFLFKRNYTKKNYPYEIIASPFSKKQISI